MFFLVPHYSILKHGCHYITYSYNAFIPVLSSSSPVFCIRSPVLQEHGGHIIAYAYNYGGSSQCIIISSIPEWVEAIISRGRSWRWLSRLQVEERTRVSQPHPSYCCHVTLLCKKMAELCRYKKSRAWEVICLVKANTILRKRKTSMVWVVVDLRLYPLNMFVQWGNAFLETYLLT